MWSSVDLPAGIIIKKNDCKWEEEEDLINVPNRNCNNQP